MPTAPPAPLQESDRIARLMRDLQTSREQVRALRRPPVVYGRLLLARQSLLRAMEAYADELTARRLPIPTRLRDDLRLQREIRRQRPVCPQAD
jgi:hypothetical protein